MILFCIPAVLLVYLSYKSYRGGINYLNFFKSEVAKPKSIFTPYATIFAPCRGIDADLESNLSALFRQDFPAYEIVFIVDDEKDEAANVIRKVISDNNDKNVSARLFVAGEAVNESQKVHNLREGVLQADIKTEIFVFVDSDARPGEQWLGDLIAPLKDEEVSCSTGYRWFISIKRNFASEMRSVWNASIASALGADVRSNFCWGGSMAIRRDVFEKLDIRKQWSGVLSDDFAVTRAMKNAGLPICFVPQALTPSLEDCTFTELLEFTTRQMKITRVYAPKLWLAALIGSFLFNLVFIWGFFIVVFSEKNTFVFWFAITALTLVSLFSIGKAYFRLKAVTLVLSAHKEELKKQFRTQTTLWILSQTLFLYNAVCASISKKITWRGTKYELISPNQTSKLPKSDRKKIKTHLFHK